MTPPDPDPAPQGHRRPNRLAREKSPYLLQHARNPVDWFPWGEEAFAKARAEDRPILLSIGYSTCHWCHVMERESFEDEQVAALLNDGFVAIKVDREERPDVDRLYMTAAQALGLGGGWPLNMFLTPGLEPFYGGTYFAPEPRYGRPGFPQVLATVRQAWSEQRGALVESGARLLAALGTLAAADDEAETREALCDDAYRSLERAADAQHGGFGEAPKFPSVANLEFLLRWWSRDPERRPAALEMVLRQLDAMRAGGIHDQLGGGFHRYSTDAGWLVPHFEKMLYDQAQLACVYLDAYQITGRPAYAATASGILGYVARDLSAPGGGFCSAEDADSEGEEGRFYVWTPGGIEAVLGAEDARLFGLVHGVTPEGNFEGGTTILTLAHEAEAAARELGLEVPEVETRLAAARARLLEARERRVRPHRDDKVVAAWNGLMISAFARGARVLGDAALAARAVRAAEFAWRELVRPEGDGPGPAGVARCWREGVTTGVGQLSDHACLSLGLIDLYQATLDPQWLRRAVVLARDLVARFRDPEHGGFFDSPAGDPWVKVRMKDAFDGAENAGNSIAAHVLERLGLHREADESFRYHERRLAGSAWAMPRMLVAMDLAASPPRHVVIAGRRGSADTQALLGEFDRRFLPRDLLVLVEDGPGRATLADLLPFTGALTVGERATAYVCEDGACRLPVTEPRQFAALLDGRPDPSGREGR